MSQVHLQRARFSMNTCYFKTIKPPVSDDHIFYLFKVSFYYYTMIGTLVCCFIGSCISFFTYEKDTPLVPKKLLCPLVHWMYDDDDDEEVEQAKETNGDYFNIQQAIRLTTHYQEEGEKN